MSNKTIHELDSLSEIAQNDEMLIYDISAGADSPTKKTTAGNILNYVKDGLKEVYSTTEEVKTNKVWIDGKPIYRKVFNYGNVSTSSFEVATNINLDTLVSYGGSLKVSDIIRPFPYHDPTSNMKFVISAISENSIYFYNAWNTATDFVFYLEYTKTTD